MPVQPEILTADQLRRKIQEMGQKSGRVRKRKRPEKPIPGASPELFIGGPGVDTGDIRITRRRASQRGQRYS